MDKNLKLANKLYEVVRGNLTCIETWGFYLFEKEFEKDVELRNKVGTIWLCSLIDTVGAESLEIPEVLKEAEECGFDSLVHNAKQLKKFCELTGELLGVFTREEQIVLVDLRNQWVHGYLSARQKEQISVKYFMGGMIKKEKVARLEYAKIMKTFYGVRSVDQVLQPIIARALDKQHRYWSAIGRLQKEQHEIYRRLREGECFDITI